MTAAETDDPQVLPLPKVPSNHNANLESHPLTPDTPSLKIVSLVSSRPTLPTNTSPPSPIDRKKLTTTLKTSQTTFKTHNFSKKNQKQKPNNQTTQQPNPTKAHTQTHYKETQPNTTITPPPLPTPHTTIRTTHRNSLGPYIYYTMFYYPITILCCNL